MKNYFHSIISNLFLSNFVKIKIFVYLHNIKERGEGGSKNVGEHLSFNVYKRKIKTLFLN